MMIACEPQKSSGDQSDTRMTVDMGSEMTVDAGERPGEVAGEDQAAGETHSDLAPDMEMVTDMAAPIDTGLPVNEACERGGGSQRPLSSGSDLFAFGEIAGDFTVQTLRSSWTLSENWTGCDSYVFLIYFPDLRQNTSGVWAGDQLWNSDVNALLQSPPNTHYFFISIEEDLEARRARMVEMNNRMIRSLSAGEQLPEHRLHFVTDRLTAIEGSVGAFARDYLDYVFEPSSIVDLGDRGRAQPPLPFVFGIDRLQRWDSGGSLDEIVGQPMKFDMASYLGPFYNHIAQVHERAATDNAIEVTLVEGRVSDRIFIQTVELPEASVMSDFDTLEVDVSVTCPHRNVFACSEWDRIARIEYCRDPECNDRDEIARWITPYWRRGERRWIWDASPFLAWLSTGGAHTFRVEMGPGWERSTERDTSVKLRLRSQDTSLTSVDATRAFLGGEFNADYNNREAFTFTPPEDVTQVELVVLLSGHGQTAQDNCAEWCDHRHHFKVNEIDIPVIQHEGEVGSLRGCAEAAHQGVSPGQFGNWAPERAYWCPGLPITPIRVDITEHVRLGEVNEMTYRATLGAEIEPRGGNTALSSYIVYSR
jgi:hypothetical protein